MMFFIWKIVERNRQPSKVKGLTVTLVFLTLFLIHCAQFNRRPSSVAIPKVTSPELEKMIAPENQRYAFEMCRSPSRNYLEDQILRMDEGYTAFHHSEWTESIPIRCVQFAQRNFSGHYAKCESEDSRPDPTARKHCLSKNYVMLAYNSFHDVMDCFSLNPKDFFLQIMIESGFHINAINRTGFDSGLAQFTSAGIRKVISDNRIERTRRVLLESSRPSCQRIASVVGAFDITSFTVAKRCSMISLPQNPYRAMLFNYLHTMLDQMEIQKRLDSELEDYPVIKFALSERVKRQFVYFAYNRGLTGFMRLLKGYIDNRTAMNDQILEKHLDLDQNLSAAKKIMALEPGKREKLRKSKIKNLSFAEYAVINKATYVADMVSAHHFVQRHLGDQCSRF